MDERSNSFGYWLRRRRKALDLTQAALAERVSCSPAAIKKIESEERRPSRALAQRLAQHLGIAPTAQAAFLEAARQPGPDWRQDDAALVQLAASRVERRAAPAALLLPGTPLVGRDAQFQSLVGLMDSAGSSGHVVLLHGEAGIGKSRMLQEALAHAQRRGLPTLTTNCYEIERSIAYQPVMDLASQAVAAVAQERLRSIAPVLLAEIAALVPGITARLPALPALSSDFPEARQARLFQALLQLFDVLAQPQPLVMALDNIQWTDDASLRFVHFLARQAASHPMLLICAFRDDEIDAAPQLAPWVDSLRHEPHLRMLALPRLALADVQQLLEGMDQAPPLSGLADRLHRDSEGNPFFVWSLLHALGEHAGAAADDGRLPLPDELRDSVRARLARVPQEERVLLERAAVLARRFHFETLQTLSDLGEAPFLQALEALERRCLLRAEPDGGHYDFSHDKVREVVYRDIPAARRALLHRTVAQQLEANDAGDSRDRHARLAEHYERGQVWPKALHYLRAAAEQSQKLFAMGEAMRWLDRAVALLESHPEAAPAGQLHALLAQRGAARAQAGATEGAVADFQRVIASARAQGEQERERDLLIQLGMAYRRADAYERATACLEDALAASRATQDERHVADSLYHLGTVAWSNGRNDLAIARHEEAVAICERLGLRDLAAVQAFHGRGEAYFAAGEPLAAIGCYGRSLDLARAIDDRSYESENRMMVGWACNGEAGIADYPRGLCELDASMDIARAADLQWHLGPIRIGRAYLLAALGRYGEAGSELVATLPMLETLALVRYQMMAHDALGCVLLDLEQPALALAHFDRGLALAGGSGVRYWVERLQAGRVLAQLRTGATVDPAPLAEAQRDLRGRCEVWLDLRCLVALAEVAASNGAGRACLAHACELLKLAEAGGLREQAAQAQRLRGVGLALEGDADGARDAFRLALAQATAIGRVRLMWEARCALAQPAHCGGDPEQAEAHATAARALAAAMVRSLGDGPLVAGVPLLQAAACQGKTLGAHALPALS